MTSRPRLVRSIPFWGLVVVSLGTAGTGAAILSDKLDTMTATLTDGTATGVDVYVGQSVAVVGAIVLGAGIVGILLALAIATIATLRPAAPVDVVEPVDGTDSESGVDEAVAPAHGYEHGLGYTEAIDTTSAPETDSTETEAPVPTR